MESARPYDPFFIRFLIHGPLGDRKQDKVSKPKIEKKHYHHRHNDRQHVQVLFGRRLKCDDDRRDRTEYGHDCDLYKDKTEIKFLHT